MSKFFGVIDSLIGVLIVIIPRYVFPSCEYIRQVSSPMKCSYTRRAELAIGIVITIGGITMFFSKSREAVRAVSIILIGLGLMTILIPSYLIGVCASPEMPCHYGMLPSLNLLGGLLIIMSLISLFSSKGAERIEKA